jgi:three-Cys-motif partner protein
VGHILAGVAGQQGTADLDGLDHLGAISELLASKLIEFGPDPEANHDSAVVAPRKLSTKTIRVRVSGGWGRCRRTEPGSSAIVIFFVISLSRMRSWAFIRRGRTGLGWDRRCPEGGGVGVVVGMHCAPAQASARKVPLSAKIDPMGRATHRRAADGYQARDADTWSEEKLMILDCYARGFATACRRAGGWYGLDLFAGTGLNYSLTRNEEMPGSPLILLEAASPGATVVLANERDPGARQALAHRCAPYGRRAEVFGDDANLVVRDMLSRVPRQAPAFAFLDPEGSELTGPTVKAIADRKRGERYKIEQLILFPTDTGFVRLAPGYPERVTGMFGHDGWVDIFERRQAGQISADHARGEYVRLYGDGLRALGYDTVLDRQMTTASGQPLYFLVFATDHEAGESIMDHCFDRVRIRVKEELGQGTLFSIPPAPRRKRLGNG